jgi:hypothetical protein
VTKRAENTADGVALITAKCIVVAVPQQVSCDVAGEAVILHLDSGIYYGLNSLATRVWALVQRPTAVSAIVQTLLAEYDVDAARLERDVRELIGRLSAEGLVQVRDERAP